MLGIERLALFLALALLAEVAGTVGGFGSSVFFVPIANLFFDFQSVLAITSLFHLASNASKLALFRHGIDLRLLLWLGVPSVLFAALGALAGRYIATGVLEGTLAVFLLALSGFLLLRPDVSLKPGMAQAVGGGVLSGTLAGLVGTGGAIRGLTLAAFNLPKDVFVATSAAIDMGIDLTRAGVYWHNGYLHAHDLIYIPLLVPVAIGGTWLGRRLLRRLPQARFRQLALIMVFGIGLLTLIQALRA